MLNKYVCSKLGLFQAADKYIQALNRAHERERYHSLLHQVFGIAFFGTPHKGSAIASWSTSLSNILRAASLGTSTNKQLSTDLESNSRVRGEISKSFIERGKRLEIFSFYEVDKMEFLNCMVCLIKKTQVNSCILICRQVVDKSSAVLGWPNEVAIAVNGDHRSM